MHTHTPTHSQFRADGLHIGRFSRACSVIQDHPDLYNFGLSYAAPDVVPYSSKAKMSRPARQPSASSIGVVRIFPTRQAEIYSRDCGSCTLVTPFRYDSFRMQNQWVWGGVQHSATAVNSAAACV